MDPLESLRGFRYQLGDASKAYAASITRLLEACEASDMDWARLPDLTQAIDPSGV